ncbi:CDP-glycerol glycerophosphotransferase family protein [Vibrio alginolyticus]|uniref:CDP-glycerol glycerophosphotransferase family protein n=1 Tax=Vibrio alginolyticus TaxID=663 RepID=UPI001BD3187A|nr:CDP-glycerol glycerophosphotransferase family protein [Vibrio alginolyticus]MBS9898252.1 CDP-glycerol glycerophosphotransferase family protein [Vibrio alginolyticus]
MLKKIFFLIAKLFGIMVASFIPKDRNIWIFGAWFGRSFSDNSKYLFEYCSQNSNVTCVWISKSKHDVKAMRERGINARYYLSLVAIYYQMRARYAFVTHSISSDLNSFVIGLSTRRIQLWHGAPIKKIGFDDLLYTSNSRHSVSFYKIMAILNNDFYSYFISCGSACSEIFMTAFNTDKSKILEFGFPRNDILKKNTDNKSPSYKVLYMPTFRGEANKCGNFLENIGFNPDVIDEILCEKNIKMTLRLHPVNIPSEEMVNKILKSKSIMLSKGGDIYEEINEYDALITDYSSIMFDFYLTSKPIYLAPFDLDDYLGNDRELYFNYDEISDKLYNDWSELLLDMNLSDGSFGNINKSFFECFHDIENSQDSSKLVFEFINEKK